MFRRWFVSAFVLLLIPSMAFAFWDNDWSFRKKITLDTSATGVDISASLIDLPVLVRLHTGNFSYFSDSKPDGSDLRFIAADDKTPLKFHVERYDSANQLAYVWVRVPHVAAKSSDFIWMYYGNAKAVAAMTMVMTLQSSKRWSVLAEWAMMSIGNAQINPVTATPMVWWCISLREMRRRSAS